MCLFMNNLDHAVLVADVSNRFACVWFQIVLIKISSYYDIFNTSVTSKVF